MSTTIGSPGELHSDKISFASNQGQSREITFKGNERFVRDMYADFVAQGFQCECSIQPGICTLVARDNGDASTNELPLGIEVELQTNKAHKSIYEPPGIPGFTMTPRELAQVQRAVHAALDTDITDTALGELIFDFTDDQLTLFNLGCRKVESRVIYQPVLTKVTTAGRLYNFPGGAYLDVGKNFTEEAMLSDLNISLHFALPRFLDPVDSDVFYGWVKGMPRYSQIAGQRVTETMTFEFGAWSIDMYPLVG